MVVMKTNRKIQSRVRTQWLALGAALVVLAGVLVAWALSQAADRVQVVQLARTVASGQAFTAGDLAITGVAFDTPVPGLVPAQSVEALLGRVAAVDLEEGVLIQQGVWRDQPLLLPGEQSVGVVLKTGRFPASLAQGDVAIAAPLAPGDPTEPMEVRIIESAITPEGDTSLTLAVPQAAAVVVAQLAATDQLVLVGLPAGVGP
jgi:hypothetical protein